MTLCVNFYLKNKNKKFHKKFSLGSTNLNECKFVWVHLRSNKFFWKYRKFLLWLNFNNYLSISIFFIRHISTYLSIFCCVNSRKKQPEVNLLECDFVRKKNFFITTFIVGKQAAIRSRPSPHPVIFFWVLAPPPHQDLTPSKWTREPLYNNVRRGISNFLSPCINIGQFL